MGKGGVCQNWTAVDVMCGVRGSASAHSITGGVKDALLTTNSQWQLMTLILYGTEAG